MNAEGKNKYICILENDARDCLGNLNLLQAMEKAKNKYKIKGGTIDAALYRQLAQNAQKSAMLALARLLEDSNNVVSVKKILAIQDFDHPEGIRELRKGISDDFTKRLKGWRNNLLAHSLKVQLEMNIPEEFPITLREIGDVLSICIQIINMYVAENGLGRVRKLPRNFDHESEIVWPEVECMVRGIFSKKSE